MVPPVIRETLITQRDALREFLFPFLTIQYFGARYHRMSIHDEERIQDILARNRKILEMRFGIDDGEPKSYPEIAQQFNISRSRADQLVHQWYWDLLELFERNSRNLLRLEKQKCLVCNQDVYAVDYGPWFYKGHESSCDWFSNATRPNSPHRKAVSAQMND